MGKLADAPVKAMKSNGKVQKLVDGDWLYAYMGPKSIGISRQKVKAQEQTLAIDHLAKKSG